MKFKDYLGKLNKMKFGFLANKGRSIDINRVLKLFPEILQNPQKTNFPQIKSNQVIISYYQEEYKRLTV